MNRPLPTETWPQAPTPREYQLLMSQAREEARRLRREAIDAAIGFVVQWIASLPMRLRARLAPRTVRAGLKPCQP